MKTLDKVVYIQSGNSFLYFFPTTGKNAYNSMTLNLALKKEDKIRGGNGATKVRDFIPNIIKCDWKKEFLNAWLSFQNLNSFLADKGYEVANYADNFTSLDDFFLFLIKERAKEIGLSSIFKADEIAKLTNEINAKKADYANKKAELDGLESELAEVLNAVKTLEKENEELLNAENLDTKTFQQNALKIAKLKHSNKALIDNRNALFNECENLESEIESLESELKELESV